MADAYGTNVTNVCAVTVWQHWQHVEQMADPMPDPHNYWPYEQISNTDIDIHKQNKWQHILL